MADSFKPLWQQIDPGVAEFWLENPEWQKLGEFWLDSLGECQYGLSTGSILAGWPTVIGGDGTLWVAKWPNLMVSLDDQLTAENNGD